MKRSGERGAFLTWFAGILPMLLLFFTFTIDEYYLLCEKRSAQNIADAMAWSAAVGYESGNDNYYIRDIAKQLNVRLDSGNCRKLTADGWKLAPPDFAADRQYFVEYGEARNFNGTSDIDRVRVRFQRRIPVSFYERFSSARSTKMLTAVSAVAVYKTRNGNRIYLE